MNHVKVRLTFPEHLIKQPIIARLVREFDVMPNIRRASVEETVGWVVCELGGNEESIEHALQWLVDLGLQVDRLNDPLES